jgi:glutaconate CoA-transferase subunit B
MTAAIAATDRTSATADEVMTVVAARELHDGAVCFVGIGLPSLAANLARRLQAPRAVLVYESGCIGAKPTRPPLSIGDGELAETATAVVSVPEIFAYWLQAGRIDVGFLGAAQLDRYGSINTTVVGPYDAPRVRLPGAGGAPEIAHSARATIVIVRHTPRAFVAELDFRTTVSAGPITVITDLGVLRPGPDGELTLTAVHHGVSLDAVRAATGWPLQVAAGLAVTTPPSAVELSALRALKQGVVAGGRSAGGSSA